MSQYSNGGTARTVTAARYSKSQANYTAPRIEPHHIADALTSMGYQHVEAVYNLTAGRSVRISAHGKPAGNDAVQVSIFPDGLAAYYTDHASGDKGLIKPEAVSIVSSAEAVERFRQAEVLRRKADAARQELQARVARQAQDMYRAGVNNGKHEYINSKGLANLHNALIDPVTGALLIPMWVSGIGLVNLQRIWIDGTKRFLAGGRVKGAYSVIGSLEGAERALVCEGWATGATLAELHSLPVVVAFNAGNLMPVCQALRSRFENLAVVIAGDDDRQNNVNTGRQKAIEAAEAIGASLLFPELCKACKCTDHNDVMVCSRRSARG